jgi:hypothetical protein
MLVIHLNKVKIENNPKLDERFRQDRESCWLRSLQTLALIGITLLVDLHLLTCNIKKLFDSNCSVALLIVIISILSCV